MVKLLREQDRKALRQQKRKQYMVKYFGIAFALFFATMLFGTWYTVDEGEQAVVLTNGSVSSTKSSGLYFKAPFFQSVEKFSVRTERTTYEDVETYSKDVQPAKVDVTISHRLDPTKVSDIYKTLGSDYVAKIISPSVMSTIKIVFGQYTATQSIDSRHKLVSDMSTAIANKLSPFGIVIDSVAVEDISFEKSYTDAVADRMKAEVEVQKAKQTLLQEQIQAEIVRTKAQGEADAKLTVAGAEAKAATLMANSVRDNPEVIKFTLAKNWDGVLPKIMLPNGATPMIDVGTVIGK